MKQEHMWERWLKDAIQSGKIVNDSVLVLKVGSDQEKESISVIILAKNTKHTFDERAITSFKKFGAEFKGTVIPAASGYVMIFEGLKNVYINWGSPQ